MVKSAENDGGVGLLKLLVNAAFTADGHRLRLISAGDVVWIQHPARAPLDAAAPIGNLATTILPLGILLGKLVADVFQVTLALDIRRRVDEDFHTVERGGVFTGNHDRLEGAVPKPGAADLQIALPCKGFDAWVGDLHREEIVVLAGDGVLADVAERLHRGVAVNV